MNLRFIYLRTHIVFVTTTDLSTINGGPVDATRRNIFLILGTLLIAFSGTLWILFHFNFFSILFALFSVYFFVISYHSHINLGKSITLFPSSLEITTRRKHHIIPFDDIISLKFQYQEYIPTYRLFHPIESISSVFMDLTGKEYQGLNLWIYEIDTEEHVYYDEISHVDADRVAKFIRELYQESGINPYVRDFQMVEWKGSLYYFSFKELHSELDPDVVRDLV